MDNYSRHIWDMIKRSINYGRKNEIEWITLPVIKTRFEALETIELKIGIGVQNQKDNDPSGHVISKNDTIAELTKRMYRFGRSMTSTAKINKNAVMLQVADMTENDLNSLPDDKKFTKFRQMISTARQNMQQLAELGITDDALNTQETDVNTIEKMLLEVAAHTSEMKAATLLITQSIAAARHELDILDDLFEAMIDNETFLSGWFEERRTKGRRGPKKPQKPADGNTMPPTA